MLGKLAKWLKIFGFDALFFSRIEDERLLSLAEREGRILLTRDTGLIEKARRIKSLFIESGEWPFQVEQVLDEFKLWKDVQPYSRCIECNAVLKSLQKRRAKNLVSPFVYESANSFSICPECNRVFWKGTHHRNMEQRIRDILTEKRRREVS